jgi:magnesium chelatase subunit D
LQVHMSHPHYPFSAIVGQDEMKLALILNAIDPSLGGVLIMGHRGTGKSTAVRGLAELLPPIWVVKGCQYRCDPNNQQWLCADCRSKGKLAKERVATSIVELPLGATEDRVSGSIDIEKALKDGAKLFEPGLIARANRGLLYIDEVNLLEDHLVDLLLDVAVTGWHRVERESVSVEHPARFALIGSGNPEEGELRPQLLDRFGLHVEISTENDPEQRVEIVERRERFEKDPEIFLAEYAADQKLLSSNISRAQRTAAAIKIERELLRQIAELCSRLKLDGHRGELTITRASRTLAAFENRKKVTESDIRRVAAMSVRHRLRREPFDETASNERIRQALETILGPDSVKDDRRFSIDRSHPSRTNADNGSSMSKKPAASQAGMVGGDAARDLQLSPIDNDLSAGIDLEVARSVRPSSNSVREGRRNLKSRTVLNSERGRYSRATDVKRESIRIAIDATLRSGELRYKQFSRKEGCLYILAIDTSGSMAPKRINRAREVALKLLQQSYVKRDTVALVAFRGTSANVALPPTRSILRAKRALDSLMVGGGTPLPAGVLCSIELAKRAQPKHGRAVIVLFTDGRGNVSLRATNKVDRQEQVGLELKELGHELKRSGLTTVVVATESPFLPTDADIVADSLGAQLVRINSL